LAQGSDHVLTDRLAFHILETTDKRSLKNCSGSQSSTTTLHQRADNLAQGSDNVLTDRLAFYILETTDKRSLKN